MREAEKYYLHIGNAKEIRDARDARLYRAFEILPGFLAWSTLILMFVFSWLTPVAVAVFIIIFDVYWFFKTLFFSLHARVAFRKLREARKINFFEKLERLSERPSAALPSIASYRDIYHLVIFPMYEESYEMMRESVMSIAACNFPRDRFIVVVSGEERASANAQEVLKKLNEEFSNTFFKFFTTTHPDGIPGELKGKGANEVWAARSVKGEIIDPAGIPYEHILVSVFDADTKVEKDYFSCLSYTFLTVPDPLHASYQPIPLFVNNIFQASAFARVISFSSTFWHLIQQARPERMTTFSSHSMPFCALVDIDFWQTNVVSEDSRIFWQCFLYYDGNWRVEPLFQAVLMDANAAPTLWGTIKNQYKQQRRWGYGAENIPYLLYAFTKNKRISFWTKMRESFVKVEAFHSWATNSILIFLLGWLPIWLGGDQFTFSVLSFNLPEITRTILMFASIGIATSAILSIVLLPPKPEGFRVYHYALYLLQWIFLPVTLIVFGAFPAIDAQTRLMLGKYMGFWFTPKFRSVRDARD